MKIESLGDKIIPSEYTLHSQFSAAINFVQNEKVVSIVSSEIGPGPCNIVINPFPNAQFSTLKINSDSVLLNNLTLSLKNTCVYNSNPFGITVSPNLFINNFASFANIFAPIYLPYGWNFLNESNNNFSKSTSSNSSQNFETAIYHRLFKAVSYLNSFELLKCVQTMRGVGFGLTPTGDDFNCGILAAINIFETIYCKSFISLKKLILQNALGQSILVNNFLYQAEKGNFNAVFNNLFTELLNTKANNDNIKYRIGLISAVGHTSGIDFLMGFNLTCKQFLNNITALEVFA